MNNYLLFKIKLFIEGIIQYIVQYLEESSINIIFFWILLLIILFNTLKGIFIYQKKRKETLESKCRYLVKELGHLNLSCNHPIHRKRFVANENSCDGCYGNISNMTNIEAEDRVIAGSRWKRIIIVIANYGKNIWLYLSLLYTLLIAIFKGE